MKRMFGVVVIIFIMYIAAQIAYGFFIGKQTNAYTIKVENVDYQIKETYTARHKSAKRDMYDENNYYYEISSNNQLLFNFKLKDSFKGIKEFLKDLIVYNNNGVHCIYPLFKEKVDAIDVICNKQGKQYLYGSIKGEDSNVEAFVADLKSKQYSHPSWEPTDLETTQISKFYLYKNNILEGQNVIIWEYKGFYRVTDKSNNWYALNGSEQYNPNLTVMVNQYFVVPDYKENNYFSNIYITNLITGSIESINLNKQISYNSFIQGIANNEIYIIDVSNKVQYSIDIYEKELQLTGNVEDGIKFYNNGKWENKSIYEAIDNKLTFPIPENIPEVLNNLKPLFVDEVGGETDGYYYLYFKENNKISVYRADKQNTEILTLLFKVPSINNVKYDEDDIYFISDDILYYYRDKIGLKPLIKYNEFRFNQSNLYNIYVK